MAQLVVMRGAFGLPSWCPLSLECSIYFSVFPKLGECVAAKYPYSPFEGNLELPYILDECKVHSGNRGVEYCRTSSKIDDFLSSIELADLTAYTALVHGDLHAALTWALFGEPLNYRRCTSALLVAEMPTFAAWGFQAAASLPNSLLTKKLAAACARRISNMTEAVAQAARVLDALDTRLGNRLFFFDRLSSLDIAVASYILMINHMRLPRSDLTTLLDRFPKLLKFASDFAAQYAVSRVSEPESLYFDPELVKKELISKDPEAIVESRKTRSFRLTKDSFEIDGDRRVLVLLGLAAAYFTVRWLSETFSKKT